MNQCSKGGKKSQQIQFCHSFQIQGEWISNALYICLWFIKQTTVNVNITATFVCFGAGNTGGALRADITRE